MVVNDIVVWDFETGGLDATRHEAIQIAGKAYNGRTFEPYPNGEFSSLMKPLYPDRLDPKALACNKKTVDELMAAPPQEVVWPQFVKWVQRWNKSAKKGAFTAPIAAGKNLNFDKRFMAVLNDLYLPNKNKTIIFNEYRNHLDLQDFIYQYMGGSDELENEKMDTLRVYFGLPTENAHDALTDTRQCGQLIMKFMSLSRKIFEASLRGASVRLLPFRNACLET